MIYTTKTTYEKVIDGLNLVQSEGGRVGMEKNKNKEVLAYVSISGVKCTLMFSEGEVVVKITDKPWLASESMIRDKLDQFFN